MKLKEGAAWTEHFTEEGQVSSAKGSKMYYYKSRALNRGFNLHN